MKLGLKRTGVFYLKTPVCFWHYFDNEVRMTPQTMNYQSVITRLYFLLVFADSNANEKELQLAKQMVKAEGLNEIDFTSQLAILKTQDQVTLYNEAVAGLRKLDRTKQIRIVAWLCVLANADGFMERSEWQLIYKIYHKELALPLNEIFEVQKELNRAIWEKSYTTPS